MRAFSDTTASRDEDSEQHSDGQSYRIRRSYGGRKPIQRNPFYQNKPPAIAIGHPLFPKLDTFPRRHIGPDDKDIPEMLKALSPPVEDLDAFVAQVIPSDILSTPTLKINKDPNSITKAGDPTESDIARTLEIQRADMKKRLFVIGKGYYGTHTPPVIRRNVLENPAWYTSYTPYQPEISQGRLECLLNYQTMISDLTGLPIANSSLLDEGTAAAEAMTLSMNALPASRAKREGKTYVVSDTLHPQTVAVMHGRAKGFGINVLALDLNQPDSHDKIKALGDDLVGVMVQYPDTYGQVDNYEGLASLVHEQGALLSAATDLLALTLLQPPGSWGADIAFGSSQRFGVPLGNGGPHAAFFAVQEKHKRKVPGRLVGVSKDRLGGKVYRLALQTREQHIRREKATSNVCTAQALLANMSALYAMYHGPEGLKAIAERVVRGARIIQTAATAYGYNVRPSRGTEHGKVLFDTVILDFDEPAKRSDFCSHASWKFIDVRRIGTSSVGISIDETTTGWDLIRLAKLLRHASNDSQGRDRPEPKELMEDWVNQNSGPLELPEAFTRKTSFLDHPIFNSHHSETEMLRYIHHLQSKDLSLVHSMIPLGSCTMKLNGTTEMEVISHPEFSNEHPYANNNYPTAFEELLRQFKSQLVSITGMDGGSLQPNSGAQGEFAGLRAISDYHETNKIGDKKRDICLIPVSAHGTNPASAAMAGMRVVPVKCDVKTGNLDVADLEAKCIQYKDELAAIMITYPSTYGVFEPEVRKVCDLVHEYGGQVYMDGANMNAQIGLCSPGDIGADVCHLNLHKTFCIPHGGGGPGVGPICVKQHLTPYLPRTINTNIEASGVDSKGHAFPVSSARYGSASISLISWVYNSLMGKYHATHTEYSSYDFSHWHPLTQT